MEQFSDELKMARESRHISLETICAITKVSIRHLEALEEGRLKELPGGVFRKGILRSYVIAVGLEEEADAWVERFEGALQKNGASPTAENDWVEFAENVRRNRGTTSSHSSARWLGVAVMIMMLAALGWGVWKFVLHGRLAI